MTRPGNRIVTVVPLMGLGGAEVVAATLVRAERAAGHDVVLASGGGFRADELCTEGVPHVDVPLGSRRPLDLWRAVRALRRLPRPDLVHAHNVKAALVARVAFGRRVPVVATVHGVPADAWRSAGRILTRVAARVVAVSPHVADQLVAHGVPADRVVLVPNGVVPVPVVDRAEARRRLGLDPEAPVALCLARLVPQKRHDLLVEAWPEVLARVGAATLLVAGDGPRAAVVREAVQGAGLDASVRMLGAREDVDVLLAATDLLVLPTDWEGLPISLLEALGAGVPAVVSGVGGVVETVGPAVRLVEPGSADALADALAEVLTDPPTRQELAARGRALVADRFPLDRMIAGHAAVRDAVVGTTPQEVAR